MKAFCLEQRCLALFTGILEADLRGSAFQYPGERHEADLLQVKDSVAKFVYVYLTRKPLLVATIESALPHNRLMPID